MSESAKNIMKPPRSGSDEIWSASTSEDDAEDTLQRPDYLVPVLQDSTVASSMGVSSIGRHQTEASGFDDDESNQYFMSEPSVSEDGDSSSIVRAPHQFDVLGIGEEPKSEDDQCIDNGGEIDCVDNRFEGLGNEESRRHRSGNEEFGEQPHRAPRRRQERQRYTPAVSPGNTSISSWENSPAVNKKVYLQFVMPETKYERKQRQARQQHQQQESGSHVRLDNRNSNSPFFNVVDDREKGSKAGGSSSDSAGITSMPVLENSDAAGPTLPRLIKKTSNNVQLLQNQNLRYTSQSSSSASAGRVERVNHILPRDHFNLGGAVPQNGELREVDTVAVKTPDMECSENGSNDVFSLPSTIGGIAAQTSVDSIAMTLSDSDVIDDSQHSDHLFEWGAQHSADDEKTTDQRPKRMRAKYGSSHRRSRSGDAAAAALATGRTWKKDWDPVEVADEDEESGFSQDSSILWKGQKHLRPLQKGRMKVVKQERTLSGQKNAKAARGMPPLPDKEKVAGSAGRDTNRSFWSHGIGRLDTGDSRQAWINQMSQLHQNSSLDQSLSPYSQYSGQGSMHDSSLGSLQSLEETPAEDSENDNVSGTSSDDSNYCPTEKLDNHEHGKRLGLGAGSPFANIGRKSAEKVPRSTFLPLASYADESSIYPTFVCPRCKTRQRDFLTVENAADSMNGPGGYLALYFAIYVVCSLFLFGLEEGWMPLDCIYFAVITLTTAGLGDYVPTSNANKIICSIFIYFGVACIGLLLGTYIAGMLDDRATRDRKENQAESCPNCAKIDLLREAAAKRGSGNEDAVNESPLSFARGKFMSERVSGADQVNHNSAVYRHNHHHHRADGLHSSNPLHVSEVTIPRPDRKNISEEYQPESLEPGNLFRFEGHQTSPTASSGSQKRNHFLGSPVTREILGRQKHTRHASIDITNQNLHAGAIPKSYGTTPARRFSEDNPVRQHTPATNGDRNISVPARKLRPIASGENLCDGFSASDDESSSVFSSSTESSTEELWDRTKSKIQAAKYVFLTLRRALINSMVIIAVGCLGFWIIEGFSLVDSWYFTTVLLTTVGYGDIVPVTSGGKLFATIYILVAGSILLNNMSSISMIPLELRKRRIERAILTQFGDHLDDAALRELATGPVIQRLRLSANRTDGLDECTREMFSLAMLVRLGKVTEQDVLETFASFRHLDVNNEGVLNSKSIIAGMIAKQRRIAASQPPPPPPPPHEQRMMSTTPTQRGPEEEAEMDQYWFGPEGSLHVATQESSFHFSRRPASDSLSERSSLLQHPQSAGSLPQRG